jgi:hypothetical protein
MGHRARFLPASVVMAFILMVLTEVGVVPGLRTYL